MDILMCSPAIARRRQFKHVPIHLSAEMILLLWGHHSIENFYNLFHLKILSGARLAH
jgi:hypothetical protein